MIVLRGKRGDGFVGFGCGGGGGGFSRGRGKTALASSAIVPTMIELYFTMIVYESSTVELYIVVKCSCLLFVCATGGPNGAIYYLPGNLSIVRWAQDSIYNSSTRTRLISDCQKSTPGAGYDMCRWTTSPREHSRSSKQTVSSTYVQSCTGIMIPG